MAPGGLHASVAVGTPSTGADSPQSAARLPRRRHGRHPVPNVAEIESGKLLSGMGLQGCALWVPGLAVRIKIQTAINAARFPSVAAEERGFEIVSRRRARKGSYVHL